MIYKLCSYTNVIGYRITEC